MKRHLQHAAVALALVAGAGSANAQTVITREITTAPVETIIERGPTGTVITRRPLDMTVPRAPVTLPGETAVIEPDETITPSRETVGISSTMAESVATRRITARPVRAVSVQKQRTAKNKVLPVRTPTVRRPINAAVAIRPASAARVIPAPAPILTAAQRNTIYRTVVEERVAPRTVITEPNVVPPFFAPFLPSPVVREQVISERVIMPSASVPVVRETVGAAPVVTERVVTTPASVELAIGSRVPVTVPLYAFPETLALRIPAVRSYRYAIVDDRLFLVDPLTNRVVTELYE